MKYIIPDFETTNHGKGNPFDPRNHAVSLSVLVGDTDKPNERKVYTYHFLVPVISNSSLTKIASIIEETKQDETIVLVGHNLRFDLHWMENVGISFGDNFYDTSYLPYLEWRGIRFKTKLGLGPLSGMKEGLGDLLVHKYSRNPAEIWPQLLLDYNAGDCYATEALFLKQQKQLATVYSTWRPLHQLMCDVSPALLDCECNGMRVDIDKLKVFHTEQRALLDNKINETAQKVLDIFGIEGFNPGSPTQVSKLLYSLEIKKEYKIHWQGFLKNFRPYGKTARGIFDKKIAECFTTLEYGLFIPPDIEARAKTNFSVEKDQLKLLVRNNREHPHVELLNDFYEVSRLKTLIGTFIESILGDGTAKKEPKHFPRDGYDYVHTTYSQITSAPGRMGSSRINLQNWPREGTFAVKVVFISRYANGSISEGDCSQIEIRGAGERHGDSVLRADYEAGIDIHGNIAREVFGEDFTDENRTACKSVVFRLLYRGGPRGIVKDPKIPVWDIGTAKSIIRSIYARYPELERGQEDDFQTVISSRGYLTTITGREFKFDKLAEFGLKFKVANYPIQSWAAEFLWCAMIVARKKLMGMKSLMIGQIHDSILVDTHHEEVDKVREILEWALTEGARNYYNALFNLFMTFPLAAEVKNKEHW